MSRLPMGRMRRRRTVHLDEHKPGGILLLLAHVEADDAGFTDAFSRIVERGRPKGSDAVRLHMDLDMENMHGVSKA